MPSDDPNHFHPDYFGKGFRWHDPQVNKMIEAYQRPRSELILPIEEFTMLLLEGS